MELWKNLEHDPKKWETVPSPLTQPPFSTPEPRKRDGAWPNTECRLLQGMAAQFVSKGSMF